MSAHDELISAFTEVLDPMRGEIRLLGRVDDSLIGNESSKEVFFFLPDLHLVSRARQARFGNYGFNHDDSQLLTLLLRRLADLREEWKFNDTHKLVTVQLGDFFDVWREFSSTARPEQIADDEYDELRDLLYRGVDRGTPCLKATVLLGNHDTKRGVPLPEVPFRLKAFNRSPRPFLFMSHGDAYSTLERWVPDALKEFVVHLAGRLTPTNKYDVRSWGKLTSRGNRKFSDLEDAITDPIHSLKEVTGAIRVQVGTALPTVLAAQVTALNTFRGGRFHPFHQALQAAPEETSGVRVVVMGHSHHAGMVLCRPPQGPPVLIVDVGAWIEKCRYSLAENSGQTELVEEPSAQLAVIHGNDARLYQIRLR